MKKSLIIISLSVMIFLLINLIVMLLFVLFTYDFNFIVDYIQYMKHNISLLQTVYIFCLILSIIIKNIK